MGEPFVDRVAPERILKRWQSLAERQGFFFFLTCFWLPVVPHNATNYIAGLSSISFWRFFWANFLGRLPGMIVVTLIGAYGFELSASQWGIIAVGGVLVIVVGRYLARKLEHHFEQS